MALTKVKLISDGVIVQGNLHASHGITTADIGEGSNLYYTDARVGSYLSSNGYATQTDIVAAITDSAPVTLDTLNELAAALGDDPNFATTTATSLGLKAPLASPSFTGNATFAGNVDINGGLVTLGVADTSSGHINAYENMTFNIDIDNDDTTRYFGFYKNGSDGSGTELLRIEESGNVGIGTSDIDFELQVGGTDLSVTANFDAQFAVLSEATTGYPSGFIFKAPRVATSSNRVLLNEDFGTYFSSQVYATSTGGAQSDIPIVFAPLGGNVGIGTTSPTNKLDVFAANNFEGIALTDSDETLWNILKSGSSVNTSYFNMFSQGVTKVRIHADNVSYFNGGNVGIGETSPSAKLQIKGTGASSGLTFKTTDSSSNETFYINDGGQVGVRYYPFKIGVPSGTANVPNTRLQIATTSGDFVVLNDGNVGIGTTSPAAPLAVQANFTANGSYTTSNWAKYIFLDAENTGGGGIIWTKQSSTYNRAILNNQGKFEIGRSTANDNSGAWLSDLVIDAAGNVGIGTDSPNALLDLHTTGATAKPNALRISNASAPTYYWDIWRDNTTGYLNFGSASGGSLTTQVTIKDVTGNVGIGTTSPNTKLDVSGTTGTRNRNTQGSSVYETSLYFAAAGNATTNVSINTATAFPPMGSGGMILVEVSASGYGNSGSNGLVFSYITGGYGGHYAAVNQPYHPVVITANSMQAGTCTWYNPNATTIGITVTTTNSAGMNGLMRVKVTTTY
jgi:hypothetical protein